MHKPPVMAFLLKPKSIVGTLGWVNKKKIILAGECKEELEEK